VDTSDEWITTRTGIRQRYFVEDETNVDLASKAAEQALERAGIDKKDLACCVVATFTPDTFTPSVACGVQAKLDLPQDIIAFDLNAACAGFIYGLRVVRGLLMQQPEKYAILIGSEIISRFMDFGDRTTCVLFGDGAGAAVLKLDQDGEFYFASGVKGNNEVLYSKAIPESKEEAYPAIKMNGAEVFRFAVEAIATGIDAVLKQSNYTLDDIDYVVCHQANKRIIDRVQKKLGAPKEKFFMNLQSYGNTSAASIPIALNEMAEKGMFKKGTKTICVGFGAGLVWGSSLIQW
jgi:3-oxoacyl-[acyl-carrier-protein] synthase-3